MFPSISRDYDSFPETVVMKVKLELTLLKPALLVLQSLNAIIRYYIERRYSSSTNYSLVLYHIDKCRGGMVPLACGEISVSSLAKMADCLALQF